MDQYSYFQSLCSICTQTKTQNHNKMIKLKILQKYKNI